MVQLLSQIYHTLFLLFGKSSFQTLSNTQTVLTKHIYHPNSFQEINRIFPLVCWTGEFERALVGFLFYSECLLRNNLVLAMGKPLKLGSFNLVQMSIQEFRYSYTMGYFRWAPQTSNPATSPSSHSPLTGTTTFILSPVGGLVPLHFHERISAARNSFQHRNGQPHWLPNPLTSSSSLTRQPNIQF